MSESIAWYGLSAFQYLHFGKGPEVIIALHGYGECSRSFLFLEHVIEPGFRLIAIDLPFHGGTRWKEDRAFTASDLANVIAQVLSDLRLGVAAYTLMGYSLGGRVALGFTQEKPQQVNRLVLLAPDGIKLNIWYWFATQTRVGVSLFRFTMKSPGWIFLILRVANFLRLINKSVSRFVSGYLHESTQRMLLFQRWTNLRKFKPRLAKIRTEIREKQLPVRLMYGEYDRIILPAGAKRLCAGLETHCQVRVIKTGHQLMTPKHAGAITKLLTT